MASVEVRYAASEKPHRVLDRLSMASLHGDLCALASCGDSKGGGPSRLLVRPRERWERPFFAAALGGQDERVEVIACGEGFAAALTSRQLLRIFGPSGLPLSVASVPGPAVALAARGPLLLV